MESQLQIHSQLNPDRMRQNKGRLDPSEICLPKDCIFPSGIFRQIQSFYDDFTKHRKNGVFETMVRFNASGSYFSPTCGELQSVMDRLIEIMVNSVGNLNRVAYLNNKSQSSGASIQSIVRNVYNLCRIIGMKCRPVELKT